MKAENDFLILLVDDDPDLLDILTRAAQKVFVEARFVQVHSTKEATVYFSQLNGYGPRLVLLDLDLREDQTGLDLVAFLRSDSQASMLPVVILTVSDLRSDVVEAYDIGVSSFTTKPGSYEGWIQYLDSLRTY